jgi:hypothetical protein
MKLNRLVALSLSAGALLLAVTGSSVAAQDKPPCPLASDAVASQALGQSVQGYANSGGTFGFDSCELGDVTVTRASSALAQGQAGAATLTQGLGLPPEVVALVAGLGANQSIQLPGYQLSTLNDLGDTALWVKDMHFGVDSLVVQRGAELFTFLVLDAPDTQASVTSLARAVLANAPAAQSVSAPPGDRPGVVADCGLDAANAVADRLQRSDVSSINVIGGCHYVAIATTLDGNGFANASAASQMCDAATEVAYSAGILGITVTDRDGHERASGANGEPCSGFP